MAAEGSRSAQPRCTNSVTAPATSSGNLGSFTRAWCRARLTDTAENALSAAQQRAGLGQGAIPSHLIVDVRPQDMLHHLLSGHG
jgi:hypothetical protein